MTKKLIFAMALLVALLWGATSGNIQWTQLASGSRHGTNTYGQSSDNSGTSGHCASYNSNGSLTDAGVACGTCATCTVTVASGTSALGTSLIASGACASTVTTTASGVATTDNIMADFNATPLSTTGYAPTTGGILTIIKWPTSGDVNFSVCNFTAASITPGAVTLNWRVVR